MLRIQEGSFVHLLANKSRKKCITEKTFVHIVTSPAGFEQIEPYDKIHNTLEYDKTHVTGVRPHARASFPF